MAPDKIHLCLNGKLSPTVTVVDVRKLEAVSTAPNRAAPSLPNRNWVSGRCTPPSTARAMPIRRSSSTADGEVEHRQGRSRLCRREVDPIIQKIDVQYQPGHNHSTMGETLEADGKYLISLNKFSKDRFINVGPLKPENDQLIDIAATA